MSETKNEKEGWCVGCDAPATFYQTAEGEPFRCSLCETTEVPVPPITDTPSAGPEPTPAEKVEEVPWTEAVPPEGTELTQELDHIRIDLKGPWVNGDLKGLLEDFTASQAAAAECGRGLELIITAVRKSIATKAREKGGIIVPFRDRHGKIIPGRALHLPPDIGKAPSDPRSLGASGIILPGK